MAEDKPNRKHIELSAAITFLDNQKRKQIKANKADLQSAFAEYAGARKMRSVFALDDFAIRFSEANTGSFSNVVLSLSALKNYDRVPFVICVVRPDRLDFRLANTTFLKRISHSSHSFRTDNIRGSFLGHDIVDKYEGIPNRPENFEKLFALHAAFTWEENVERLVETTNAIIARSSRFLPTPDDVSTILGAPTRAEKALDISQVLHAERDLVAVATRHQKELLQAATLENVNIRGNTLEQIITGDVNAHRLDDLRFNLPAGGTLVVDIKTKLLDRASAPKAYNIDKMLRTLSKPGSVFSFFFVGLDISRQLVATRLISVFDPVILAATRIQTHWAGRASRGVTQLTGNLAPIFGPTYRPSIDVSAAEILLRKLIER